jgi:hypothetical protein
MTKYMKEGLDDISSFEISKIYPVLFNLNKDLKNHDSKWKNRYDSIKLNTAIEKKLKQ